MSASDVLCWMSAWDLAAAIRRRKVPAVEVADAVLGRIDALKRVNAYVAVDADGARKACFDRLAWWEHARAFFTKYDLLLTPTVACPPLQIGELFATEIDGKRVGREAGSAFTFPFNMTGRPACTLPCGFTTDGLPIGLQIVGRRFADITVFGAAAAFEAALPWAPTRPPLA